VVENNPGCEYVHEQDSGVRPGVAKWSVNAHKKEGVDTVHILGFGFGCTGLELRRIGEVFSSVADFQGERLVRVPPWARVFPLQGLFSL
jgi:hypothetical protein